MGTRWQTPQQLWLRPFNRPGQPSSRLVCLPHAGGSAQVYRSWPAAAPADVGVYAVQYPGRQDRFDEPPAHEMSALVRPLADALAPWAGERLALFGHSMGAAVAYELTLELERRHGPVVDLLVVSGALAPHVRAGRQVHREGDAALVADVRRLNPSGGELFDDPDLFDLLIPMIRADYRLSETYRRPEPAQVHAEVLAVGGHDDPDVADEQLQRWSAVAGGRFTTAMFPGDHFYLVQQEAAVVQAIAARLPGRRVTLSR